MGQLLFESYMVTFGRQTSWPELSDMEKARWELMADIYARAQLAAKCPDCALPKEHCVCRDEGEEGT